MTIEYKANPYSYKLKETSNNDTDPFFDRKIEAATDGLPPFYKKCIMNLLYENAKLVIEFINSEVVYKNVKLSSKRNKIVF